MPWCTNDMVTNESGIRDGLIAIETDTVEKLTGRKPIDSKDLLGKYRFVWKEKITTYWELGKVQ